jgi:hypothetical protein
MGKISLQPPRWQNGSQMTANSPFSSICISTPARSSTSLEFLFEAMCGRAACTLAPRVLQQRLGAQSFEGQVRTCNAFYRCAEKISHMNEYLFYQENYRESYNVGPGRHQPILVCRVNADGTITRHIVSMRWGLVRLIYFSSVRGVSCTRKLSKANAAHFFPRSRRNSAKFRILVFFSWPWRADFMQTLFSKSSNLTFWHFLDADAELVQVGIGRWTSRADQCSV